MESSREKINVNGIQWSKGAFLVRGEFKFMRCTLGVLLKDSKNTISHIIEEQDFKINSTIYIMAQLETLLHKCNMQNIQNMQ